MLRVAGEPASWVVAREASPRQAVPSTGRLYSCPVGGQHLWERSPGGTGVGKGVGEFGQLVDYVTVGEVLARAPRRSERPGGVFRWPAPGPG